MNRYKEWVDAWMDAWMDTVNMPLAQVSTINFSQFRLICQLLPLYAIAILVHAFICIGIDHGNAVHM